MADTLRRGQAPDQRDHIVRGRAGGLGDDQDPVEPGTEGRACHVQRVSAATRRVASARTGGRASAMRDSIDGARRAGVSAATEPSGQDRRVHAAWPGPDADARLPRPASLNRMATSAASACDSRSMIPSECARCGAGRGEVGVGHASTRRCGRRRRSRAGRARRRTAAAGRRAWCDRGAARCPRAGRRPRRAPPRRRASAAWRSDGRRSRCP